MTLEEASAAALEAARSGDLVAVAQALAARAEALSLGELPTAAVHATGELTVQLLRDLIRDTGLESARLRQLALAVSSSELPLHVDVAG
jgi:hypothetical protein